MSLELIDRLDTGDNGLGANTGYLAVGNFIASPSNAGGVGVNVAGFPGARSRAVYYERFDAVFCQCNVRSGGVVLARIDPLLETNTGALYDLDPNSFNNSLHVGQFDREGDLQPFYVTAGAGGGAVSEVDPLNIAVVLQADAFPGYETQGNGLFSTDPGFFSNVGQVVFFEGLGSGGQVVHLSGNANIAGGAAITNTAFIVDLATDLTIELLWSARDTIFGDVVDWTYGQFVQDDDSTAANPKGEMMMFATGEQNVPSAGTDRWYHQRRDWNPNNVVGIPSRTHQRQTLLTAFETQGGQCPGQPNGVPEAAFNSFLGGLFVPTTRQVWGFFSNLTAPTPYPACESVIMRFSENAAIDIITDPSPVGDVTTNKTVPFRQEVRGSLSEPIGGVRLDYALDRRSTEGEILPVTPSAGESVAVANPPINFIGTVVVRKDAAVLVEGVDYNLTRDPGGSVDFIAPEPVAGPVYTVDYEHFQTGATPANGLLLDSTAVTDVTGTAEVRVKYAENTVIEGEFDGLDGSQP